jgi:DNA-binding CsgD family transcriptional regulator
MLEQLPYTAFERDAFIRTAEVACTVSNRRDFFLWLRLHLNRFIPHELALCHVVPLQSPTGAHLFNSVSMDDALIERLKRCDSALWTAMREAWLVGGRRASVMPLAVASPDPDVVALRALGFRSLLVHGVDATARLKPEALYAFALNETNPGEAVRLWLDLWMADLHACSARALDVAEGASRPAQGSKSSAADPALLTLREIQVLSAVRASRRTAEIAEQLGISPLTVKNHMRKIMAKLGARSRVHAVAEAMTRQIIS